MIELSEAYAVWSTGEQKCNKGWGGYCVKIKKDHKGNVVCGCRSAGCVPYNSLDCEAYFAQNKCTCS